MAVRRLRLCILASFALAALGPLAANAIPSGTDTGDSGAHDFTIDPSSHGHAAHWSWVATPPTDAPTVTPISYFLHSSAHGGAAMSAAQVSDIHAAAATWSASGANLSLTSAASDAIADIHVHMDTSSACGGGIGCAAFTFFNAHDSLLYGDSHPQHEMRSNTPPDTLGPCPGAFCQELTMFDDSTFGPSWYSGAAAGIGGDLDFLTVAIQEFGHHLGLEHNDSGGPHPDFASSPMNGLLPSGTTRRVLVASDTAATIHLYGVVPEPSTFALTLLGMLGLALHGARRPRA